MMQTTGDKTKHLPQLDLIFTREGFVPDVRRDDEGKPLVAEQSLSWLEAFETEPAKALYDLGFVTLEPWMSPTMSFLHRLSRLFFAHTIEQPDIELVRGCAQLELTEDQREALLLAVPFAPGSEFVTQSWLNDRFAELSALFKKELAQWPGTVASYVAERTQDLRVPERIFFHVVENKAGKDEGFPFAFVATYATELDGAIRHYPLRYALEQYRDDTNQLVHLIADLSRAADQSEFLSSFIESGELFYPLRLTQDEAYQFLCEVPAIEKAGILCRVPAWWRQGSAKPRAIVRVGDTAPGKLNAKALLQLVPSFAVDDVPLSREEVEELLSQSEGLALIKGKWVEVDHERLHRLLEAFDKAHAESLTLFEAIRKVSEESAEADEVETVRGLWLDQLLRRMQRPTRERDYPVPATLKATLRPYQQVGYSWLSYLSDLGFGACLADDMGLGKTVQLIALLERLRITRPGHFHGLLVVPASLVGNWLHELATFAPTLDYALFHGTTAARINEQWEFLDDEKLSAALPSLCITTYGMAQRLNVVGRVAWDVLVLDEAQAIKNPRTKQTRALKAIRSGMRIALTGTPVENDLSNLWSLFDFLDPGLLGTMAEFKRVVAKLNAKGDGYAPLRRVVSPFLLRRLKTDKTIIDDLPDKVEIDQRIELTRSQVVLYRKVVAELKRALVTKDHAKTPNGITRQGLVLSTITKLKQICNHPDQYLGQEGFSPKQSGKFLRLAEICQTIYEKRERVLVFTQFKELTEPLAALLEDVFERPGCVIHGGLSARWRTAEVARFQGEDYVPFMVLSLRAGGTGLNLTAANHVIHFDRWWNPAVENQATDRAFRIGQEKDVMVHRFMCTQTLEEHIAQLIDSKSRLIDDVVGTGETWIGDLDNNEILDLVRLG